MSFDLVILDMIMPPGIDGLETYRQVFQFKPSQKVLLVSAFFETEQVKKAIELGAGQFIKKHCLKYIIAFAVRMELDNDAKGIKNHH